MTSTLIELGHPGFRVVLVDPDQVSESNIGRQRFTRADIGQYKADVMAHRLNLFYGSDSLEVMSVVGYVEQMSLYQAQVVIGCVDSTKARLAIAYAMSGGENAHYHSANNALWLDCGNDADRGQVVLGSSPMDDSPERLPNVLDLYPEMLAGHLPQDDETPSCSVADALARQDWPVNRQAAIAATDLLWALFRYGKIEHHAVHFQCNPMKVTPMPIDPDQWAFFGYDAESYAPEPVMEAIGEAM
jgi:PRTRC genetic system ThiF family protein